MTHVAQSPRTPRQRRGRPYLEVDDLRVHFTTEDGVVKSVDGLSFHLERGQDPRHRR